jgi:hypothetical protein
MISDNSFAVPGSRRVANTGMALALLTLLTSVPSVVHPQSTAKVSLRHVPIYTWIGNTPAWDRMLHVSGYRMGCDNGDPRGCVHQAEDAMREHGLSRIFLSMPIDAKQTPRDAREYGRLSRSNPQIIEAGFDDFIGRYKRLFLGLGIDPPSWLRSVLHDLKSENPSLAFGITLYEDELESPYLVPPRLPADIAQSVDFVHLFLHYRADASQYAGYVERAKAIFPRAKVIAGLYAYDRINYIPCSPGGLKPCTSSQEIALFNQAVRVAAQLVKQNRIAGIEFYPGFFGKESEWGGWKHPDYCAPRRVQECIDNTRAMRANTLRILSTEFGW